MTANSPRTAEMRALVVGGTGPSGVPIVEGLIARGYHVTLYHRGLHPVDFSAPVQRIIGDPFSQAAIVSDLADVSFDLVISTYGRLRYIAEQMAGRTSKFIGITSGAAYVGYRDVSHVDGGLPSPIAESHPTYTDRSIDAFGWAVAEVERQIMRQHARGDFDATVFRYPNVYGPRGTSAIRAILQRAMDRRPHILVPGNGGRLRNRGYVDNLAHAVLLAIGNSRASGQIYNISDERTLSLSELVTCVAEAAGHRWDIVPTAHPIVEEVCRGYVSEPHHQLFDLSKAKAELGYGDTVPVLAAVRKTVEWHLEHPTDSLDRSTAPNSGGHRGDPLAYDLEDRLVSLQREFAGKVSAAIPSLGRSRRAAGPHREDLSMAADRGSR